MMKKIFSYLTGSLMATAAFAEVSDIGEMAEGLTGQVFSFGNLLVVLMMVLGFWCLYKIVMTFMNREDERAYPMKNLPLYFAGAAVGLGSALASDMVQKTFFGDTNSKNLKDDLFKVDG